MNDFKEPEGATPLDPDEKAGLRLKAISTRGELNAAEQENILKAAFWADEKKHKDCLTEKFIRDLHERMLDDVWKWAGTFRQSDKSIGVHWVQIGTELKKLIEDTRYWIKNNIYDWDELGARFHHRLVYIHPFPNGNGRHARLMTDILLQTHGQPAFSWGGKRIDDAGATREAYIAALREADEKRFVSLIKFVRS